MAPRPPADPYAPPPMHHDRSGAIVRIAIVAALLGAAAWGYTSFTNDNAQTALAPEPAQGQVMADSGPYTASPSELPEQGPSATPAAPQAAPAGAAPTPTDPVPPPSTTTTPSVTPPPVDMPPAE